MDTNSKNQEIIKEFFEAGVHFGHTTSKRNPLMAPYIYGVRNGINILNIAITAKNLHLVDAFLKKFFTSPKPILFIGTKWQAKGPVAEAAAQCGEHFVNHRWLGGQLTNFKTVENSIKRYKSNERLLQGGPDAANLSKKKLGEISKLCEKQKLAFDGIRNMRTLPGLAIIVDGHTDKNAVDECRTLGIPMIALADSNCDPTSYTIALPANDDHSNSINCVLKHIVALIKKNKPAHSHSADHSKFADKE